MTGTSDSPSVWDRPGRGTRGPAPALSRADVVTAAIGLADAEGLAAVTMRAVAASMGTAAGGLYRYVESREELLVLMADAVLAEALPTPQTDRWLDDIVAFGSSQLDLYRRHPWLLDASVRPGTFGPRTLDHFERGLGLLSSVPASTAAKFEALAMVTGLATLFARPAVADGADPVRLFALARPETHPELVAALANPVPGPVRADLFERSIRGVVGAILGPE